MLAWHFLTESRRTRYSNEPVLPGSVLRSTGPLRLCSNGMHASESILDALQYAPGPIVCRVRLHGEIMLGDNKLAAEAREVLWMYDATEALRAFAAMQALSVSHLWDMPSSVHTYLMRGGDDATQAAARKTAWEATQSAVLATARDAARAAWIACEDAFTSVPTATARAAAQAAAWDAFSAANTTQDGDLDAAWDTARNQLEGIIMMYKPTF